jgi:tetratricopeptide (TPR) repeat protein
MDEAVRLLEPALAGQARVLGPEHPETLETQSALGYALLHNAEFARAERALRLAAEGQARVLGPAHPQTLQSLKYLATALYRLGREDEATRLAVEVAEGHRQTFGPIHIKTSSAMGSALANLRRTGDVAASRDFCGRWLREILATPVQADPFQRGRRSIMLSHLALDLATLPEPIPFDAELAVRAAEEAVALVGHGDNAWEELAVVYYRSGRFDKATQAVEKSISWEEWKRKNLAAAPGSASSYDFGPLVFALIHARRGEMDQAHAWYDKVGKSPDSGGRGVAFLQLLAEAEALLGVGPPREGP